MMPWITGEFGQADDLERGEVVRTHWCDGLDFVVF